MLTYSYYNYNVGYVDSSYVYTSARVSIRGATGATGATYTITTADYEAIAEVVIGKLGSAEESDGY